MILKLEACIVYLLADMRSQMVTHVLCWLTVNFIVRLQFQNDAQK